MGSGPEKLETGKQKLEIGREVALRSLRIKGSSHALLPVVFPVVGDECKRLALAAKPAAHGEQFQNGKNNPHTPAVFVRVANKGVTPYGTWK